MRRYWAQAGTQFEGLDGSNRLYASAYSGATPYIWPNYTDPFELGWGVTFSAVTNNLSFTGITPGPVRTGVADILIDSEGGGAAEFLEGGSVSFVGVFRFECKPYGTSFCGATAVPFPLGVPFSLEITSGVALGCPGLCSGAGKFASVELKIWDAAGNPVPIYAASAVPEPGHLASIGLALIGSAYVIRRRLKR
jgi:hypothetical protein